MRGITRDCVVEMFDRKIVHLFVAMTVIAAVISLLVPRVDIEFHTTGNMDMGSMIDFFHKPVTIALSIFLSFMVFLAVLATAGLIPNMLVKGRADFFLSKPLSRTGLLLHKILGIWLVYGAMIALCGSIVYAVMVLVHGLFDWKVLYLFVLNLVSFFIWLSITITVGIVSGSSAISIMSAFLVWVAQAILKFHDQINDFLASKPLEYTIDTLYYIVPKTGEISNLADTLALGKPVESWVPLYSSLAFSAALLVVAVIIFKRKNY